MITKKDLIIEKYKIMIQQLNILLSIDIFPEFINCTDIVFYFNYNFLMIPHPPEKIEDILEINNIYLDDEEFGKVCDIIIDFLILLNNL